MNSPPRIMPLNQVRFNHPPITSFQSTLSPNQASNPLPVSSSWTTTSNMIFSPLPVSSSWTTTTNQASNPLPVSSSRNMTPIMMSNPPSISSPPSPFLFNQVPSSASTVSPRVNSTQTTVIHQHNFTSPQLTNEDSSGYLKDLLDSMIDRMWQAGMYYVYNYAHVNTMYVCMYVFR